MALEVLRAAKSLGLAVPRQLSLVTFDDADWTSAIDPAVTVVAQPTYRLGFEAARMLIERIGAPRADPGGASSRRRSSRGSRSRRRSLRVAAARPLTPAGERTGREAMRARVFQERALSRGNSARRPS